MDIRKDEYTNHMVEERAFLDFLYELAVRDDWKEVEIRRMHSDALRNAPLLIEEEKRMRGICASDEAIQDTMEHSQLLLVVDGQCELLRESAVSGVFSRAGLAGRSLREFRKQGKERSLSGVVNTCLDLYGSDIAKVLIRGEKISAVQSRVYQPIPQKDLFERIGLWLDREGFTFETACFTHVVTESLYHGKATSSAGQLSTLGIDVVGKKAKILTGDTGNAAVCIYPQIEILNAGKVQTLPCGSEIRYIHRTGTGDPLDLIESLMEKMFLKVMEDGISRLTELVTIPLRDGLAMFEYLVNAGEIRDIPTRQAREAVASRMLDGSMTAFDMICTLQTVAETHLSVESRIDAEESIMRLLGKKYIDWH